MDFRHNFGKSQLLQLLFSSLLHNFKRHTTCVDRGDAGAELLIVVVAGAGQGPLRVLRVREHVSSLGSIILIRYS